VGILVIVGFLVIITVAHSHAFAHANPYADPVALLHIAPAASWLAVAQLIN
jgi:predicted Co/Zn/Cd cation transporter (cation efflux family)